MGSPVYVSATLWLKLGYDRSPITVRINLLSSLLTQLEHDGNRWPDNRKSESNQVSIRDPLGRWSALKLEEQEFRLLPLHHDSLKGMIQAMLPAHIDEDSMRDMVY